MPIVFVNHLDFKKCQRMHYKSNTNSFFFQIDNEFYNIKTETYWDAEE